MREESHDDTPSSPRKIRYTEMAQIIAPRWKALDKEARVEYENSALEERTKYFTALKEWEQVQEQEKAVKRVNPHVCCMIPVQRNRDFNTTCDVIPALPDLENDHEPVADDDFKDLLLSLDFSALEQI